MRASRVRVWGPLVVLVLSMLAVVPPSAAGSLPAGEPHRPASGVALADGLLRQTVARVTAGRPAPAGVDVLGNRVRVEILVEGDVEAVRAIVRDAGGVLEGEVPPILIQALVPIDRLEELEASEGVGTLRPPLLANEPQADVTPVQTGGVLGAHVQKTNAPAWHAAGWTGAGIQVGIVDYFDGAVWGAAQANGDVPAPSGTFCRDSGASCDIWASGVEHGVGVAEVIYDMAPGVQLYVASAVTSSDLQAAVSYFAANGVDIVSRSLTAEYDGPGNGTGPIAQVIDNAVAQGMVWFNSAGNSAGAFMGDGSYWRGGWSDPDADGWLNFATGDELMGFGCGFVNGLRWNDWASARTDYDIYVFDDAADASTPDTYKAASIDDQGAGAAPLEHLNDVLPCGASPDYDLLAVKLYAAGGGTGGDILEFMTNGTPVEYSSNPYSAGGPATDTANAGALAIGAIDPALGTTIASYSSWGPTNDGRTKPDLSAASCVSTTAYGPNCFNGTSAATPVVAGAAALILDAGAATTPSGVKTYLLTQAEVDRGAAGTDNVYGAGELILPTPPTGGGGGGGGACTITGDEAANFLTGTAGNDVICGMGGNDVIVGGAGDDTIIGGAGWDYVDYRQAPAGVMVDLALGTATGGEGTDTLSEIEALVGSAFADVLMGDAGENGFYGMQGNDVIAGREGSDWAFFDLMTKRVYADLRAEYASGQGLDDLLAIENLWGTVKDDTLIGNAKPNLLVADNGDDWLEGVGGSDTLWGEAGNDWLWGGRGNDDLYGGPGSDVCVQQGGFGVQKSC